MQHGRGHGGEPASGGGGEDAGVGGDGEFEVAVDAAHGGGGQRLGVGHAAYVVFEQGDVGGQARQVGAALHGDAHMRAGQGGGVVHAVADEGDFCALRLHLREQGGLAFGQQLGVVFVKPQVAGEFGGAVFVVAGEHDDAPGAQRAQARDGFGGVVAHGVFQADDAQQLAAKADVKGRFAFLHEAVDVVQIGAHVDAFVFFDEVARADDDALALHHAGHAVGGDEAHFFMVEMAAALAAGGFHHGLRQGMEVVLFNGGGQVDQVGRAEVGVIREGVGHSQAARGEGAGFVEDEGVGFGQALQRVGPLEEQALAAGGVHGGFEGHGRGELEGAGVVGLEHGGGAPPVAREKPGRARQAQHAGHELVGQAAGGQLRAAFDLQGVLHVVGDARAGGARAHALGVHAHAAFFDHGAGEHGVAPAAHDGHALAGHAGFVHGGFAAEHGAVHGDEVAGGADDGVAHLHVGGAHLHFVAFALDPDAARVRVQQVLEQIIRAAGDGVLQVFAQRQHEQGGVGGELIAAGGGDGHGQGLEHVGVQPFGEQVFERVGIQRQGNGQGGGAAQRLGHLARGQQQGGAGEHFAARAHQAPAFAVAAIGGQRRAASAGGSQRGQAQQGLGDGFGAGAPRLIVQGDGAGRRVQAHAGDARYFLRHAL